MTTYANAVAAITRGVNKRLRTLRRPDADVSAARHDPGDGSSAHVHHDSRNDLRWGRFAREQKRHRQFLRPVALLVARFISLSAWTKQAEFVRHLLHISPCARSVRTSRISIRVEDLPPFAERGSRPGAARQAARSVEI